MKSILCYCRNVFKSLLQTRQTAPICGKGLTHVRIMMHNIQVTIGLCQDGLTLSDFQTQAMLVIRYFCFSHNVFNFKDYTFAKDSMFEENLFCIKTRRVILEHWFTLRTLFKLIPTHLLAHGNSMPNVNRPSKGPPSTPTNT